MKVDDFDRNWQAVVSKGEGSSYRMHRRNALDSVAWKGASGDISDDAINVDDGQWHHVVGTATSTRSRLYIDGVLVASGFGGSLNGNTNPLMIGNNPDEDDRNWVGEIVDVAIWHREITAAEVTEIFTASASLGSVISLPDPDPAELEDGLTAYWSFDGTLVDEAENVTGSASTVNNALQFTGSGSTFGTGLFGSGGYLGTGEGQAIAADQADIEPSNSTISVSLWTKVDDFDRNWQAVVSKGEGNSYRIHRNGGGDTIAWRGASGDVSNNGIDVDDGDWHHIVGTSTSARTRLYVDGVLVASGTGGFLNGNANPLMIGNTSRNYSSRSYRNFHSFGAFRESISS